MQIEIKIDEKCKEPKIIVMTDKMTDEVNAIIKRLSDEQPQVIAGFREDVVEVLEPSEIYRVFAESGKVFAETICITLSNGTVTYVSRRSVAKIKQLLGL